MTIDTNSERFKAAWEAYHAADTFTFKGDLAAALAAWEESAQDELAEAHDRAVANHQQRRTNMTDQINPAPIEFPVDQLAADPILKYFHYAHLPPHLQIISIKFYELACSLIALLPCNAERTVALRKLLEAKDAGVRANVT